MKKVMKSILAMLVCLSVVLTTFSMTAFASTAIKVSPVYIETADGVITASAVVSNIDGTEAADVKLILAQYVGDSFDSVNSESVSVVAGGEKLVKVTADEVSGATVKCFLWEDSTIKPLADVANENAAPELSGISVDGVLLDGFSTSTTSYTVNVAVGATIPVIKGIPTDNALISKTVYNNDNTVTVTVSNASGASKVYAVTLTIEEPDYVHAIQGAIEDSDFNDVKSYFYSTDGVVDSERGYDYLTRSKTTVASTAVGGDGYLYTNLHAGNTPENAGFAGSPANTDWVEANSGTYRYISAINDNDAVGADFFIFKGGNANTKAWNAVTDNDAVAAMTDGETWVKFTLARPARVTIYAPGNVAESPYVTFDEWAYASNSGSPFIITQRKTDAHVQNYSHKLYKDFPAGEVVIPYYTVLGGLTQSPIITVAPVGAQKEIVSDFKNLVSGMTFDEYAEYADETVTVKADGCDGEIIFKVELNEDFGVDSILDTTSKPFTVTEVNPVYGLEGCYFIGCDRYLISDGNASTYRPWMKEAFSGRTDTYSDTTGVGFKNIVPWASFKVNADCDVLFVTTGTVPDLEDKGYVQVYQNKLNDDSVTVKEWYSVFRAVRDSANNNYRNLYVKTFEAGQTVDIYNAVNGCSDFVYIVRPR